MNVVIDGFQLENLREYRAKSRVFELEFIRQNVYGVKTGFTQSVTDGYWLMLKPLLLGDHTLHLKASALIPEGPATIIAKRYVEFSKNLFQTEVLYNLTIM